ncbi:uncharacterized protein LOC135389912 [Ornithodoros turicata]|uniref:uncharacterized protein LOC135389912 n=1 Tax=Ornithodoros turicata TaxID=34597 RepID=UPI003139534E
MGSLSSTASGKHYTQDETTTMRHGDMAGSSEFEFHRTESGYSTEGRKSRKPTASKRFMVTYSMVFVVGVVLLTGLLIFMLSEKTSVAETAAIESETIQEEYGRIYHHKRTEVGMSPTETSTEGLQEADAATEPKKKSTRTKTTTLGAGSPLKADYLLCSLSITHEHSTPMYYPSDSVCDLLVLHVLFVNGTIVSDHYFSFADHAVDARRTQHGLDIDDVDVAEIYSSDKGDNDITRQVEGLRDAWDRNIHHYGTLNSVLTPNTTNDYLMGLTRFLSAVRYSQQRWTWSESYTPYVFLGISVLYGDPHEQQGAIQEYFHALINVGMPTVLVYQSVYAKPNVAGEPCRSTGPLIMTDASEEDQPTLEKTIQFQKSVAHLVPSYIHQVFAFTPCGRGSWFTTKQNLSLGHACLNSSMTIRNQTTDCRDNAADHTQVDPVRKIAFTVSADDLYIVAYETRETLFSKMCEVQRQTNIASWAIVGVACSPHSGLCEEPAIYPLAFPSWVKSYKKELANMCKSGTMFLGW